MLEEAERERDVFRKKYLAEQRLHLEAERDLQHARESNRELSSQVREKRPVQPEGNLDVRCWLEIGEREGE